MGSHPLKHHCRSLAGIDPVGQADQPPRIDSLHFGIGTANHGMGHPVSNLNLGHAVANSRHHARGLGPRAERRIDRIQAGAVIDVDEVHANGFDPN